ncbi:hypothetical protein BDZ94DRAFT_83679 [Collybia nuda]|uniref:Uncharacterized protein n=1 Tax=Collybia nuda TaxID=64659 RepID=A0A9P6CF21_9AGAR|nr:hypothetical protein BDZ94DRAFT_83679 [Collybia nuda]
MYKSSSAYVDKGHRIHNRIHLIPSPAIQARNIYTFIMFSSTTKLAAIALLGLTTSVNALGCYGSGLVYGDVSNNAGVIAGARNAACGFFAGSYPQGGVKDYCYTVGSNRINFEVRNNAGTTQSLSQSDCVAAMTIEMNACSHGSEQNHGSFYYYNDPNAGAC